MAILVSNANELLEALTAAAPGTTIELASGNYGDVVLNGFQFSQPVTLRSQDPAVLATFDSLSVKNASGLTFDSLAIHHVLAPGEPDWVGAFKSPTPITSAFAIPRSLAPRTAIIRMMAKVC